MHKHKLILVGPALGGKTIFLERLIGHAYNAQHHPTLGVHVYPVRHPQTNPSVDFAVWDCSGNIRFRDYGPVYHVNAEFAIVVYDILSAESLDEVLSYIDSIRSTCGNIPIALHANKVQLQPYMDDIRSVCGNIHIDIHADGVDVTHEPIYRADRENVRIFHTSSEHGINLRASLDWFSSMIE